MNIKYALERIGFDEKSYYVVSKCYVIEKRIKYLEDNQLKENFEVVFPYDLEEMSFRRYPTYYKDKCIVKTDIVDEVFDTLEEAEQNMIDQNRKILMENIEKITLNDCTKDADEVRAKYLKKIQRCSVLEDKLSSLTEDMIVTKEIDRERLIERFLVYKKDLLSFMGRSLSKEERNTLPISNKSCDNCLNLFCDKEEKSVCDQWENDVLFGIELLRKKEN